MAGRTPSDARDGPLQGVGPCPAEFVPDGRLEGIKATRRRGRRYLGLRVRTSKQPSKPKRDGEQGPDESERSSPTPMQFGVVTVASHAVNDSMCVLSQGLVEIGCAVRHAYETEVNDLVGKP